MSEMGKIWNSLRFLAHDRCNGERVSVPTFHIELSARGKVMIWADNDDDENNDDDDDDYNDDDVNKTMGDNYI